MSHRTIADHPPGRARRRLGAAAAVTALAIGGTVITAMPALAAEPDFGPNVTIIDESWSVEQVNAVLQAASHEAEFSLNRHQFFFKPGTYGSAAGQDDPLNATGIVNSELGYYQAVAGLGASPEDVRINGAIHVEPVRQCEPNPWDCQQPGSLTRFWRSMSNLTFNPIQRPVGVDADRPFPSGITSPHEMRFAVSQAAPMRRINIEGSLTLFGRVGEYASGGYLANSKVDGRIVTGSQQQWFTRNSEVGQWEGGVWNMVFSGVEGAPATDFGPLPDGGTGNKTTIDETPVVRESPFLYLDGDDYKVFVPKAKQDARGIDWSTDASAGESIDLADFFVAKEGDSAAEINAALDDGKHLLLTPGVYHLDAPLAIERADTVVLGLGYASLVPDTGEAAIEVGDVAGVKIAGITVDAGLENSDVLVQVGPAGASVADPSDPTTLTDVFIRIGGPWAGRATTSIEVNSPSTLLDHIWAWRADHGDGVAWDSNTGDHGVIVNGDDVTALGLFVEHYQKNQVIWNGERGRTIFYQSEIPYDPPTQAAYMDGDRKGFASYRVADGVTSHLAQGLGVYSFFDQTINGGQDIRVASGIQAPKSPDVRFESMTSVMLNGTGGINAIINDAGAPAVGSFASPQLVSYPPADTTVPTVAIASNPAAPGPGGTYASQVTLTVTASDDYTPPPAIEANVDGAGWQTVTGPITLGNGAHTVLARATDASGNVSAEASWSGTVAIVVGPDVPLDVAAHTQCLDEKAYIVVSAVNRAALPADIRLTSTEGTVKFTKVAPGETVTYLWKVGKKVDAGTATVAGYTWSNGQGKYSTYKPAYDARSCK
ncbi:adenylyl cyclase [Agromyces sp. LHK192]|uniref:adenylyl cyclase n=1 Tax=Agromyces sp. LHK192 TaxID=2498704 RepID=UPI00196B60AD|nr:adenylyl cyclase [Agromyces sp. LHK192]